MSRAVLWMLMCASWLTLISGCAVEEPNPGTVETEGAREVGSLGMNLEVADGVEVDQVSFTITSDDGKPMSGTIPLAAGREPVAKVVTGVPEGEAELVLAGKARNGALCEGRGRTTVRRDKTSLILIWLHCAVKGHKGNIDMRGRFNVCPEAELATCVSEQTTVGQPLELTASGSDPDDDRLRYQWTATSGSFSDDDSQSTVYTCRRAGTHTIEFSVDDGRGCKDSQEFTVFCSKGARPVCGNGTEEGSEECDDGNRRAGDGCAPDCTDEPIASESILCGPEVSGIDRCTCDRCEVAIDAAENAEGTATAGRAAGTSKAELAIELVQCMRESECHGLFCLCGETASGDCLEGAPMGPCIDAFLGAAETDMEELASTRLTMTEFALGLANAVDACSLAECDECM
jgi:cysteine-rich repeat protein